MRDEKHHWAAGALDVPRSRDGLTEKLLGSAIFVPRYALWRGLLELRNVLRAMALRLPIAAQIHQLAMERPREMASLCEALAASDRDSLPAWTYWFTAGHIYDRSLNDIDHAIACYHRGLDAPARVIRARAYELLAQIYTRTGQEQALLVLCEASERDPDLLLNAAHLAHKTENYDLAYTLYEKYYNGRHFRTKTHIGHL